VRNGGRFDVRVHSALRIPYSALPRCACFLASSDVKYGKLRPWHSRRSRWPCPPTFAVRWCGPAGTSREGRGQRFVEPKTKDRRVALSDIDRQLLAALPCPAAACLGGLCRSISGPHRSRHQPHGGRPVDCHLATGPRGSASEVFIAILATTTRCSAASRPEQPATYLTSFLARRVRKCSSGASSDSRAGESTTSRTIRAAIKTPIQILAVLLRDGNRPGDRRVLMT